MGPPKDKASKMSDEAATGVKARVLTAPGGTQPPSPPAEQTSAAQAPVAQDPAERAQAGAGQTRAASTKGAQDSAEEASAKVDHGALREERSPVPSIPTLEDPRVPTWSDQVAALRVRLIDRPPAGAPRDDATKRLLRGFPASTGGIYRYSRGDDLTNDEMGYGERISEPLWAKQSGGKLERTTRTSQRTKSGRQELGDVKKPTAEGSEPGPKLTGSSTAE